MRLLLSLFLAIAVSTNAVNGVHAADETATASSAQVCTAEDYADGSCIKPEPEAVINDDDEEEEEWDEEAAYEPYYAKKECTDKDTKCESYAKDGACTDNPAYMTYNCAVTCNTCKAVMNALKAAEFVEEGVRSEPCMDDDYRCLEWAGMGECDDK